MGTFPLQGYYDPVLADYRGQTYLLHVLNRDIAMTPISLTNGSATGPSAIVVRSVFPGGRVRSPCPLLDAQGELLGVSYHEVRPNIADHYVAMDLDASTPGTLLYAHAVGLGYCGVAAGRFFHGSQGPNVMSVDAVWFTGGRAPIGSAMQVAFYSPPTLASEQYFSALIASDAFLPTGQLFPGVDGLLGLNLGGLVTSRAVLHDNLSGSATLPFFIPNNPVLRGMRVPAQSVTLDGVRNRAWFGNTAWLTVE